MTAPPWSRPRPIVGSDSKTVVHVLDTSKLNITGGFTDQDTQGVPYIVLPCGIDEPTIQGELQHAAADALHQATHLFNARERPLRAFNVSTWLWMHEAMAVFMETIVMPENQDYFRFLKSWIDMPQVSLDNHQAGYQASMFIRYLSAKLGLEFVSKVWAESRPNETPLEAFIRLMPPGQKFSSPDPDDSDIFA